MPHDYDHRLDQRGKPVVFDPIKPEEPFDWTWPVIVLAILGSGSLILWAVIA